MARTLGVTIFPAALIALLWLRLEERPLAGPEWVYAILLGLAPALAPLLWVRLALIAPATSSHCGSRSTRPPPTTGPASSSPSSCGSTTASSTTTTSPSRSTGFEHPHMHGVLVLAIFGFCVLLGQFAAARKPMPAVLTVIAGAGRPATLYPLDSIFYGALILAAALWVARRPPDDAPAACPSRRGGAGAGGRRRLDLGGARKGRRARVGALGPERPVAGAGVRQLVWDATYGGIEFAKSKTTVLRIRGPERGLYWRATTLDQFTDDRWIENLPSLNEGVGLGPLEQDPLLPRAALDPGNWTNQDVEIVALADRHLVAATQARSLEARQLGRVEFLAGGVMRRPQPLARGSGTPSTATRPGRSRSNWLR